MKFITFIVSLSMLISSLTPCSDGNNNEEKHLDEIGTHHNHQNHNDDTCPATCICNCCGIAITYQSIQSFDLGLNIRVSSRILSVYQSIYRFDFHSNIWQPPQLIC